MTIKDIRNMRLLLFDIFPSMLLNEFDFSGIILMQNVISDMIVTYVVCTCVLT